MTKADRTQILELHRKYGVNHVVFLMNYRYDVDQVNQVLRDRIAELENRPGIYPVHGDLGLCPTCHAEGTFDMDSPPGTKLPPGTNWIWFGIDKRWECGECWLK